MGENLEVSFVHTAFLDKDGSAAVFEGCLCFERDAFPTEVVNEGGFICSAPFKIDYGEPCLIYETPLLDSIELDVD